MATTKPVEAMLTFTSLANGASTVIGDCTAIDTTSASGLAGVQYTIAYTGTATTGLVAKFYGSLDDTGTTFATTNGGDFHTEPLKFVSSATISSHFAMSVLPKFIKCIVTNNSGTTATGTVKIHIQRSS